MTLPIAPKILEPERKSAVWGLRWLSGLAAVFREFRRRADLDHVAPTGKRRERKPQPEAKRRDRVSTRRSEPLVGRSAVIPSAVLATELTEDGTAARPSDDPERQPRGERPSRARRGSHLGHRPRASEARSAGRREDVRDGSPKGQDAAGGLLRSTTARPAADRRRDTRVDYR